MLAVTIGAELRATLGLGKGVAKSIQKLNHRTEQIERKPPRKRRERTGPCSSLCEFCVYLSRGGDFCRVLLRWSRRSHSLEKFGDAREADFGAVALLDEGASGFTERAERAGCCEHAQ